MFVDELKKLSEEAEQQIAEKQQQLVYSYVAKAKSAAREAASRGLRSVRFQIKCQGKAGDLVLSWVQIMNSVVQSLREMGMTVTPDGRSLTIFMEW